MDFEQIQIVWDEQKQQRLYALDLDALHASVRQRGRRIARGVEMMEIGMILISIVTVGILAVRSTLGRSNQHPYFLYVSSAVLVGVAVYLIGGRMQRRARERKFESNLLGDLDLAISRVDYHIRRIRTFPLWFCVPLFATLLVGFLSKLGDSELRDKPTWIWLLVLVSFPISIYVTRLELRCLLPRKRELDALRTKLTNEI